MTSSELPKQVFKLGERVMFRRIANETWLEGTVCEAILMGDHGVTYMCVADSGYSDRHLEVGRDVRPISAIDLLGKVVA